MFDSPHESLELWKDKAQCMVMLKIDSLSHFTMFVDRHCQEPHISFGLPTVNSKTK